MRSIETKQKTIAQYQIYDEQWQTLKKNRQFLYLQSYQETQRTIDKMEKDLALQQVSFKDLHQSLVKSQVLLEKLDEKITYLQTCEKNNELLTLYCKCIDLKTGIPHLALQNLIQVLESRCNEVLSHIADFGVRFELSQSEGLEKNKRGKFLNITTFYHNGNEIHASLNSGSQKFILDLVLRVVLLQISHVSQPNFLMIDEGFGCLDESHFEKVKNASKIIVLF